MFQFTLFGIHTSAYIHNYKTETNKLRLSIFHSFCLIVFFFLLFILFSFVFKCLMSQFEHFTHINESK